LEKGSLDAADALATEADKLGSSYTSSEDSPKKVKEDIAKKRTVAQKPAPVAPKPAPVPPKPDSVAQKPVPVAPKPADAQDFLTAARSALSKGDLDQAEHLAHEADKASSAWTMWSLRGDSPAKVLKDVLAERTKQAAPKPLTPPNEVAQTKTAPAVKTPSP